MFTPERLSILNAARTLLHQLASDAHDAGNAALDATSRLEQYAALSFGKLSEACDQAEEAIFNVLNVASSNCHQPIPTHALHNSDAES